ncbi:MAG: hypothetical protein K6C05_01655 [Anaerovibrio sp.]|uniref:hypothetical protein n=1 Tax=Anaerovibrio sp. TaxID=1872532 RepID=UPI0025D70EB5|nr:hypothetical protein [Anaerovibrio sp.]MCR5175535.1 hypothetical protein [Anaerovibrio sp.]
MKKILFTILVALFAMSAVCSAATGKIAVIPYLDTTEATIDKDYLPGFMHTYYNDAMGKLGLSVIPEKDVQAALDEAGYDVSNQMIADKDIMAAVAEKTGADYVVAVELNDLKDAKHESFFQYKISVSVKMRYNFYTAAKKKLLAFQVTGADENKTILGGVGTKSPIKNSLKKASGKANDKIKIELAANKISLLTE